MKPVNVDPNDCAQPVADGPSSEVAASQGRHDPPAGLHGRLLRVSQMATIGEMAAGVAHELNQPLTAIANYAQACIRLLGRPGADSAELQEALQEIDIHARRAGDIIHRLRALAGSGASSRAPLSINALVKEIVGLVEADARLHKAHLSLELADFLPQVTADGGQIQHVILSLVRNSLEALAPPPSAAGRLLIRTSVTESGDVELAVMDNGPGLSPQVMEHLFDPFFSTKEHGTGLGLAMSTTIARAHGGRVGYRPNYPVGACFYILLPARPAL